MINKSFQIAIKAHENQLDKAGKPYILHLLRVSDKGKTDIEKVCGLLHDLIEDTDWTFDRLKQEGFSEEIIDILECLTRKEDEDYTDFIGRLSQNPTAIKVKLNDLEDNMNIIRLSELTEKDVERLKKYLKAYHYLRTLVI